MSGCAMGGSGKWTKTDIKYFSRTKVIFSKLILLGVNCQSSFLIS